MTIAHRLVLIGSIALLTTGMTLGCMSAANAQAADPANDFLPTYTGPQNGDLDVLSTGAIYDGTNFRFFATMNGTVGSTAGAFYVWGIDRGAGAVGFPTLAPGVTFDRVLIVTPSGTNAANAVGTIAGNTLAAGSISFTGNSLSVIVPAAFLPSTGKALTDYTINLWPRFSGTFNGSAVTGNAAISDFAPNNSNVAVTVAAPEPGSLPLAAVGALGLLTSLCVLNRKR